VTRLAPGDTSRDAIDRHLAGILASPAFARSKKLGAFLSWIVKRSLAGDREAITERNIALEVYARRPDFDAKIDGTIRVEAMRLRHKLREYYEASPSEGRIEIPKGTYAPSFIGFDAEAKGSQDVRHFPGRWLSARAAVLWAATVALLACGGYIFVSATRPSGAASSLVAQANRLGILGDMAAAQALLDKALSLDPGNPEAHLARAYVLERLGLFAPARQEALQAQDLALARGVAEPAIAERLHDIERDPRTVERLRAMLKGRPMSLEWQLELARVATSNQMRVAAIQAARRLPGAERYPELDRIEALDLGSSDKILDAIALVERGEQKARALKAGWMLSRLKVLESGLRLNNKEIETGIRVLREARDLCLVLGDDICVAQTYRIEGNHLYYEGHYGEALSFYRRGLGLTREWQNWAETNYLLQGVEAALDGLHARAVNLPEGTFAVLPEYRQ
jgi:tetratricopeptide (TPR) repeat protein